MAIKIKHQKLSKSTYRRARRPSVIPVVQIKSGEQTPLVNLQYFMDSNKIVLGRDIGTNLFLDLPKLDPVLSVEKRE